jgi:nucleoid DNA-binding protein
MDLAFSPYAPGANLQVQCKGRLMPNVTKKDLVDKIAELTKIKRIVVKKVVQCFLDETINELGRGNRLELRDFGVFETKSRSARVAQNPKTLQRVQVPSKRTVKFKVGRLMKDRLQEIADAQQPPATES